jgi:type VI secretion system secreted protein VgrG
MAITSDKRICKVTSPLGGDALLLTGMRAWERVSGLFRIDCSFVSEDANLDFDSIVGKNVCIETQMAGGEARYFHGVVARFAQSDSSGSNIVYQAQLVPWLWLLTRSTDCRIFQGDSVIDIVKKVFGDFKLTDYELDVNEKNYKPIPYCVQYRETHFNFVSRLLERAGIGYYFRHEKERHVLVLFDSPSKNVDCPGQAKASYKGKAGDDNTPGQVFDWDKQQELRTGACALRDYNYGDPSMDLGVEKKTQHAVGGNDRFEVFDYPGEYADLKSGEGYATLLMEAEEAAAHSIRGTGSCYGMSPGFKFKLLSHYRESFNTDYLITEVRHSITQDVGGAEEGASYANSFSCIPHEIPYRPLRVTPKPVIQGVQTAVVVGESGKEIDIDELGNVVVQFHWDRKGKKDAASSCRVRVASPWAGKEWGAFSAPRIGQEVIVEFLEGDPDRPIITGRVYNAEQMPPYSNGEHSGMKSRSTPKGGASNFNEIRMEDSKGKELFFLQAERDLALNVKSNKSETVGGSKTIQVTGDHSETVTGSMSQSVSKTSGETVTLGKATSVGAAYQVSVGAAMNTTVIGAKMEEVGGYRLSLVAGKSSEKVGSKDVSTRGKYSMSAGKDFGISGKQKGTLSFEKDASIGTKKNLKIDASEGILIESDKDITLKAGKAEIVLKKDGGVIEIKCQKLKQEGKSEVKVKGGKVAIN